MAFFKFRWPGQKEQGGKAQKPARPSRVESIEVMRRRARHRLIGAAMLVLLGVVGFPILFDTQPRPIPVDIPIEIPDRNKVAPLVVPAPEAPPVASPPAARAPERTAPSVAQAPAVTDDAARDARKAVSASEAGATVAVAPPKPRAEPKPESKPAPAAEPRSSQGDEGARARALLEGRAPANASVAASTLPDRGRFIVQIGAFAEAEKAREARLKLERAGIKTYAQVVETKEGKRIRVRVGPFDGKAEAEKAAARIKGLNLPVSILLL